MPSASKILGANVSEILGCEVVKGIGHLETGHAAMYRARVLTSTKFMKSFVGFSN